MNQDGQQIKAGEELPFRVVTGFIDPGFGDLHEIAGDISRSLNLAGGTDRYPLEVTRGNLISANFFLELEAEQGVAAFQAGGKEMYSDLPCYTHWRNRGGASITETLTYMIRQR